MLKNVMKVGILLLLLGAGVIMIFTAPVMASANTSETLVEVKSLNQVKVASVYERVSDGVAFGRSTDDVINIFRDTNTDLIFRGFFRWEPVPESPYASLPGYPSSYVKRKTDIGYTYSQLRNAISQIKAARPNTIIIGGIAAQYLNRIEFNDVTHASYSHSQTWAMAFDPAKFGIMTQNKTMIQCLIAQSRREISSTVSCPQGFDPRTASAYFPDITNKQYQALLISSAQKQIDLGADAIWIDALYSQANYIEQAPGNAKNPHDPAIKASFDASSSIIDRIHEYGKTKYGKHIYVGTWATFTEFPYPAPAVDFVTVSPTAQEIKSGFNDKKWDTLKKTVTNKVGLVPIYVFIDWDGSTVAPMGVFSQDLTPAEQNTFLQNADAFFTKKGMTFVYPVHGGVFPMNSMRLSYGKFPIYDSVSPEFGTYETIKTLSLKKVGG